MTEIKLKKLMLSQLELVMASWLNIITDVTLFLLAVSLSCYRVNGNTLTLVEKWQKKYGLELKEKDLEKD